MHELRQVSEDLWESKQPLSVRKHTYFFHYKYAVVRDDKVIAMERGIERIADLKIMPPPARVLNSGVNPCDSILLGTNDWVFVGQEKVRQVCCSDTWERHWINFMVYQPALAPKDKLIFSCEAAGITERPMQRMSRALSWMNCKYGSDMVPWQISVEFDSQ